MDFVKAASELRELLVAVEVAQHQIRALGKSQINSLSLYTCTNMLRVVKRYISIQYNCQFSYLRFTIVK